MIDKTVFRKASKSLHIPDLLFACTAIKAVKPEYTETDEYFFFEDLFQPEVNAPGHIAWLSPEKNPFTNDALTIRIIALELAYYAAKEEGY